MSKPCYRVLSYRWVTIGICCCSVNSYWYDVFRVTLMKRRVSSLVKKRCLHLNVLSHESPRCARLHTGHRLRNYTSSSKAPSHVWVDLLFCYSMQCWCAVKTFYAFCAVITVLHETLSFSLWIPKNSATTLSFFMYAFCHASPAVWNNFPQCYLGSKCKSCCI